MKGVLKDMAADAGELRARARSEGGVSREEALRYANRQELRMLLLRRQRVTEDLLRFAREVLKDVERL